MRLLAAAIWLAFCSNALAQVPLDNPLAEIRKKCVAEAVGSGDVRTEEGLTYFVCGGQTAQEWFDVSVGERTVDDKNGVFVARYYGDTGYCAHQVQDKDRKPTSNYVCEVVAPAQGK
jgi:hypothetical protein